MAIKRAIKAGNKSIISFKKVIKVGEITQLVDKDNIPATKIKQGVTFTNNGDGSVTANGVSTNQYYSEIDIRIGDTYQWQEDDHKYLLLSGMNSDDNGGIECILWVGFIDGQPGQAYNAADLSSRFDFNFTIPKGQYIIKSVKCRIRSGYTAENVTFTPQLFDLTEMFGAGHEPATVAEFKAKFPEAYYPYQRAVLTVYNKVVRPCVKKGEVVQLVDPTVFNKTQEVNGITYTGNNGVVSASGTAVDNLSLFDLKTSFSDIFPDHIYLITGCPEGGSIQTYNLRYSTYGFGDIGNGAITSGKNINNFRIAIKQGTTVENLIFTPQLFDLTAMYGAGNEPKTFADFRKDFPESYYPYSPIQTKNLFDIRKYTGLISSHLNNESASFFIKNLAQNSLRIKIGAYGIYDYLREPIILPAGTYTFSCNCNYDAIYNRGGVHLNVGKKNENNTRIISIREGNFNPIHRLILTFTLAEETKVYLCLQGDGGPANYTNLNNVFFNIQLEKGSVATDYVPHDYI